jgi:single-strand DNA-binding protein
MNIIGRVTRDAEVRSLSEDKKVVNFSIAVNDSYKPKNGEKVTHTEFFDCSYWLATGIAQYLTKGSIVELTGRLSSRAYLDSEGNPKAGLNFHTAAITLHGGNSGKPQQDTNTQDEAKPQAQPQQDTKVANPTSPQATQVYEAEVVPSGAAPDDDLPF